MSPKDLNTIGFLDKILKAGVSVLKIEGRGRSPEYVKTVVECYREAVNAFFNDEYTEENIAKWNQRLGSVYNRGFWDGYYLGKKLGEWTKRYGSQSTHRKMYVGKVTNYYSKLGVAEIKIETNDLSVGEEIKIIGPTTGVYEDKVSGIRVDLLDTKQSIKGEFCSIPVKSLVRRGDKLYKIVEQEIED